MAKYMQKLMIQLMFTNQKYVDPSPVLNSVVDDFGNRYQVGQQQDVTEYLLNFMERLEEGLNEIPPDLNQHVRVSEYLKRGNSHENGNPHESILDTAVSTMINERMEMTEEERIARLSKNLEPPNDPSYSKIDDSFF